MTDLVTILAGDCREHMRSVIAPQSVHCVVFSPPYWALRDYGIAGVDWADGTNSVWGNEPTLEAYLAHTLEVFEGIQRVLRPDGVVWMNIGDTYSANGKQGGASGGKNRKHSAEYPRARKQTEAMEGSRLMIPERVAITLSDAGWCIRQENIWAKPSPMPESISGWSWQRCRVKLKGGSVSRMGDPAISGERSYLLGGGQTPADERGLAQWADCPGCAKCEANGGLVLRRGRWRHTTAHEKVYQLTLPGGYFSDAFAAAEPAVGGTPGNKTHKGKTAYQAGDEKMRTKVGLCNMVASDTRNPRSIWNIASESYKGAHFATFPTAIPFRCITASTSAAGCCPACGVCYSPILAKVRRPTRPGETTKIPGRNSRVFQERDAQHSGEYRAERVSEIIGNRDPERHVTATECSGYRPSCTCHAGEPVPCTVYDPCGGSGTTGQVAAHMGRRVILSEMSEAYRLLIPDRIAKRPKCLGKTTKSKPKKTADHLPDRGKKVGQPTLFSEETDR